MVRQPNPAVGQSWQNNHQQLIVRIIQVSNDKVKLQNEKNDSVFIMHTRRFLDKYTYVGTY